MNKINKQQLLKSFISIVAIFTFNLPTFAALNINYGNLFVIPQNTTGTSAAKPFALRGLVGQAKGIYNLTTINGLVLSVKNSKDAKLDFSLKPFIGANVELAGTHIPGAYDITVQMVNGSELQSAPTSTPPTATTTPATP